MGAFATSIGIRWNRSYFEIPILENSNRSATTTFEFCQQLWLFMFSGLSCPSYSLLESTSDLDLQLRFHLRFIEVFCFIKPSVDLFLSHGREFLVDFLVPFSWQLVEWVLGSG
jgi:hypothetical protein